MNYPDAISIATAIKNRQTTAYSVISETLNRINQENSKLNCFTTVMANEAISRAEEIDAEISLGNNPGILAGVPFAVKNLFDIASITTIAGSKIHASNPPATRDATAIARLKQAGGILVGALNMDEYAYGFVTENSHYGATHNPHDLTRIAGGSSGGSAAAVAGGLVPLSLGSDTNGSIRVPAAFCGIFGLKPTYGLLDRSGTLLFSSSLDCIGPFARSLRDIITSFNVLNNSKIEPLDTGIEGLRIAIADDYFTKGADPEAIEVVEEVAKILGVCARVTIPEARRARAAAYIITAAEGANQHLENLKSRPGDFDKATRDRFLAGALIPASWYIQAQRFRRWYKDRIKEIFEQVDIILAPATPCVAPFIGQETMSIGGLEMKVRPNLGCFTQPISFVGLPVLCFPIMRKNALPLGVQIIAAPYNEANIFRVASILSNA